MVLLDTSTYTDMETENSTHPKLSLASFPKLTTPYLLQICGSGRIFITHVLATSSQPQVHLMKPDIVFNLGTKT